MQAPGQVITPKSDFGHFTSAPSYQGNGGAGKPTTPTDVGNQPAPDQSLQVDVERPIPTDDMGD